MTRDTHLRRSQSLLSRLGLVPLPFRCGKGSAEAGKLHAGEIGISAARPHLVPVVMAVLVHGVVERLGSAHPLTSGRSRTLHGSASSSPPFTKTGTPPALHCRTMERIHSLLHGLAPA